MNTKKIPLTASIAALFATTCLLPNTFFAQESPAVPIGVVVTSASGAERPLPGFDYMLGRAGLGPDQLVTVTLQFPEGQKYKPVSVSSLDGGEISAVDENTSELYVGEEGTTPFRFRGGRTPGLYRLRVRFGPDIYWLEFYVLDLERPEKNPPRVQIVN